MFFAMFAMWEKGTAAAAAAPERTWKTVYKNNSTKRYNFQKEGRKSQGNQAFA